MSYYYIGSLDPRNPSRWTFQTSVKSTGAILSALREAGFSVSVVQNSESVSPFLDELDISKPGATRGDVEAICESIDPTRPIGAPPSQQEPPPDFPRRR
jgi:hypothetical protein